MSPRVIIVWVSMPLLESTTRMPSDDQGYGPSLLSTQLKASGVYSRFCAYLVGSPLGTHAVMGTPLEQLLTQAATFERQSRKVNGPPATYDPRTFGEIQVYYGPALMWDEIRRRVGDDTFWEMVRAWPSHDPDGSSNRDDYLPWIEEQTGEELSDLFDGWLFAKRSPRFD